MSIQDGYRLSVPQHELSSYSEGTTKDNKTVYLRIDQPIHEGVYHAFIRLRGYSQQEFINICLHHYQATNLLTLPKPILNKILSYLEIYNIFLRVTCTAFQLLPVKCKPYITFKNCAYAGNIDAAKYLQDQFQFSKTSFPHLVAASMGNIKTLEMFKEMKYPGANEVCQYAAKEGHLDALAWGIMQGYECDMQYISKITVKFDNNRMLQLVMKYGPILTNFIFGEAIINNRLCVLKWLRKNKISYPLDIIEEATAAGHFRMVKWAIRKKYPYYHEKILKIAKIFSRHEIHKWLTTYQTKINSSSKVILID